MTRLKAETGETNLCIAGGVGLNSVLNGRLARELGFTETFVPAYPGDDGIAVGSSPNPMFLRAHLSGSYLNPKTFWYHSTPGSRVIKKRETLTR